MPAAKCEACGVYGPYPSDSIAVWLPWLAEHFPHGPVIIQGPKPYDQDADGEGLDHWGWSPEWRSTPIVPDYGTGNGPRYFNREGQNAAEPYECDMDALHGGMLGEPILTENDRELAEVIELHKGDLNRDIIDVGHCHMNVLKIGDTISWSSAGTQTIRAFKSPPNGSVPIFVWDPEKDGPNPPLQATATGKVLQQAKGLSVIVPQALKDYECSVQYRTVSAESGPVEVEILGVDLFVPDDVA